MIDATHILVHRDGATSAGGLHTRRAAYPARKNRREPAAYDVELYQRRQQAENFFEKLKRCRRVATRDDQTASSFMAFVLIACWVLNLRK